VGEPPSQHWSLYATPLLLRAGLVSALSTGEYLQGVSVNAKRPHYLCSKCTHVWIDEDPTNTAIPTPLKTASPK
jgi:hypothetical protein